MNIRIFHNPRCSKSRQTLKLLEEQGVSPDVIEYLKTPPDAAALRHVLGLLGMSPRGLMRSGEAIFEALGLADPSVNDEALIQAMVDHPVLIERPIVMVDDQRAVLGRPPENVLKLFE